MQMEKRREAAVFMYLGLLLLMVITSMNYEMNVVNLVYLVVVLCCGLKFILIVNKDKK